MRRERERGPPLGGRAPPARTPRRPGTPRSFAFWLHLLASPGARGAEPLSEVPTAPGERAHAPHPGLRRAGPSYAGTSHTIRTTGALPTSIEWVPCQSARAHTHTHTHTHARTPSPAVRLRQPRAASVRAIPGAAKKVRSLQEQ